MLHRLVLVDVLVYFERFQTSLRITLIVLNQILTVPRRTGTIEIRTAHSVRSIWTMRSICLRRWSIISHDKVFDVQHYWLRRLTRTALLVLRANIRWRSRDLSTGPIRRIFTIQVILAGCRRATDTIVDVEVHTRYGHVVVEFAVRNQICSGPGYISWVEVYSKSLDIIVFVFLITDCLLVSVDTSFERLLYFSKRFL